METRHGFRTSGLTGRDTSHALVLVSDDRLVSPRLQMPTQFISDTANAKCADMEFAIDFSLAETFTSYYNRQLA